MFYTASYYAPEDWKGRVYRVSRGHPRGRKTQWETLPFLYPSRKLLTTYQEGALDFAGLRVEYTRELEDRSGWPRTAHQEGALDFAGLRVEYRRELEDNCQRLPEFGKWLAKAALEEFTLPPLCFERAAEPCHRQILAQWLLETVPGLEAGGLR